MVGELITLPLRVGVRATQLWLRAAGETVAVVAGATGRLIDRAAPRQAAAPGAPTAREAASGPAAHATSFGEPEADVALEREPGIEPVEGESEQPGFQTPEPPAETIGELPTEPEPVHVSEQPVLVEEVAEPGAEDGAGAAVHVEEPWKGYEQMKADEVVARLAGATPAELAAIQLYESERKGRVTVLEAVQRELQISSGSGSHR